MPGGGIAGLDRGKGELDPESHSTLSGRERIAWADLTAKGLDTCSPVPLRRAFLCGRVTCIRLFASNGLAMSKPQHVEWFGHFQKISSGNPRPEWFEDEIRLAGAADFVFRNQFEGSRLQK